MDLLGPNGLKQCLVFIVDQLIQLPMLKNTSKITFITFQWGFSFKII